MAFIVYGNWQYRLDLYWGTKVSLLWVCRTRSWSGLTRSQFTSGQSLVSQYTTSIILCFSNNYSKLTLYLCYILFLFLILCFVFDFNCTTSISLASVWQWHCVYIIIHYQLSFFPACSVSLWRYKCISDDPLFLLHAMVLTCGQSNKP